VPTLTLTTYGFGKFALLGNEEVIWNMVWKGKLFVSLYVIICARALKNACILGFLVVPRFQEPHSEMHRCQRHWYGSTGRFRSVFGWRCLRAVISKLWTMFAGYGRPHNWGFERAAFSYGCAVIGGGCDVRTNQAIWTSNHHANNIHTVIGDFYTTGLFIVRWRFEDSFRGALWQSVWISIPKLCAVQSAIRVVADVAKGMHIFCIFVCYHLFFVTVTWYIAWSIIVSVTKAD